MKKSKKPGKSSSQDFPTFSHSTYFHIPFLWPWPGEAVSFVKAGIDRSERHVKKCRKYVICERIVKGNELVSLCHWNGRGWGPWRCLTFEVRIYTGRLHQIRVHLSHEGARDPQRLFHYLHGFKKAPPSCSMQPEHRIYIEFILDTL